MRDFAFQTTIGGDVVTPGTPMDTTLATSVSGDGFSFISDTSIPFGQFDPMNYFAISDRAFNLTQITPDSGDLNGDNRIGNGAMINPMTGNDAQGFEQYWSVSSGKPVIAFGGNDDPAASGAISVAIGDKMSIVKALRLGNVTDAEQWQTIGKYARLHILPTVPDVGSFAPSPSSLLKPIYNRSQLNYDVLRSLTMPSAFSETPAQTLASVPVDAGEYGATGERLRRYRLDAALGTASNHYSTQLSPYYAKMMMQLHRDTLSVTDRDAIILRVVNMAIQQYGLYERGRKGSASFGGGAGQIGINGMFMYYGAFLLGDANMLAAAQDWSSGMISQAFWQASSLTGDRANDKNSIKAQPFFEEMEGAPFLMPDEYTSSHNGRYVDEGATIMSWELLAVCLLQNGPGGVTGAQALLAGDTYSTGSRRAAALACLDRFRTWNVKFGGSEAGSVWEALFDAFQSFRGVTPWTGKPDQLAYGNAAASSLSDDMFSVGSGAGEIDWTTGGRDFSTLAVTLVETGKSLDGYQYIAEGHGTSVSGTLTGQLVGAPHFCAIRKTNSAGTGPWSANYPLTVDGSNRGIVTPTGSVSAAAPVNTVLPEIVTQRSPRWGGNPPGNWKDAGSTLQTNDVVLAIGDGYWSGDRPTSFAYEWQVSDDGSTGWSDIGSTKERSRTAAEAGKFLRGRLRGTNASGTTEVFTPVVECPPALNLPDGVLIDTDFRSGFAVDYEGVFSTFFEDDYAISHLPSQTFDLLPVQSNGALRFAKQGNNPRGYFVLPRRATAGQQYRVQSSQVANYAEGNAEGTWDANATLRIRDGSGNDIVGISIRLDVDSPSADQVITIDETFTVPAGLSGTDLDLQVRCNMSTSTGGTSGGDVYQTSLTIGEAS